MGFTPRLRRSHVTQGNLRPHPSNGEAFIAGEIVEGEVSEIPEWARLRANELLSAGDPRSIGDGYKQLANWVNEAFARYIAEHEDPPVDPLAKAVADAMNHSVDRLGVFEPEEAASLIHELRKRGIELAEQGK